MKDYTMLIEGIITVIVALITIFVIPWIKSKIDEETLNKIVEWVKFAVQAAEQIFRESGMGEKKKAYVEEFLREKGIEVNDKELDVLIEAAVFDLKKEFNK